MVFLRYVITGVASSQEFGDMIISLIFLDQSHTGFVRACFVGNDYNSMEWVRFYC